MAPTEHQEKLINKLNELKEKRRIKTELLDCFC
jgi:hypothetical protein